MINQGCLCAVDARLDVPGIPEHGYPLDRPLYLHQQTAIEKAIAGRNLVVATGTGSGKTETFMLPVVDLLLREQEAETLSAPVCAPCCFTR